MVITTLTYVLGKGGVVALFAVTMAIVYLILVDPTYHDAIDLGMAERGAVITFNSHSYQSCTARQGLKQRKQLTLMN